MIHQISRDLAVKLGPLVPVHFLFAALNRTPAAVSFDSIPFTANELKHAEMILRPKENHSSFAYVQGYVRSQVNLKREEGTFLHSMGENRSCNHGGEILPSR